MFCLSWVLKIAETEAGLGAGGVVGNGDEAVVGYEKACLNLDIGV